MTATESDRPAWSVALVVFSGRTDLKRLRILKPGFRHCFVVLRSDGAWQVVEPMAHRMNLSLLPDGPAADLAIGYRRLGLRVVEVHTRAVPRRPAPVRALTCVEVVKRILGLRLPLALTPRQLFRAKKKQEFFLDI